MYLHAPARVCRMVLDSMAVLVGAEQRGGQRAPCVTRACVVIATLWTDDGNMAHVCGNLVAHSRAPMASPPSCPPLSHLLRIAGIALSAMQHCLEPRDLPVSRRAATRDRRNHSKQTKAPANLVGQVP
jgi:hypothetical protein